MSEENKKEVEVETTVTEENQASASADQNQTEAAPAEEKSTEKEAVAPTEDTTSKEEAPKKEAVEPKEETTSKEETPETEAKSAEEEAPKADETTAEEKPAKKKTIKAKKEEAVNVEEAEKEEAKQKDGGKPKFEDLTISTEDFDWEEFESGLRSVSQEERAELTNMYEDTISPSLEGEVVSGKVVQISDREAVIDIGSKSEGVISLNEFRYNPDLKEGDEVEVLVDLQEDKNGQLVLSHRKARAIKAWDRVNEAHDTEQVVTGYVKCRTKGGMIVDVFGIEAFLPGSQIDVRPIKDYDIFVDKTMEFKIVKINHEFKNVVVSHKALIEADLEEQKKEIISKLEKGQVIEGVVKNITSYGVFIDLGGIDGLIHITDLSWSRINHPSEVVEIDQKINVVILDFDEAKTRIQLGLKQLEAHPWDGLPDDLKEGDKIKGKVVVIADYGAFVEIIPGVEGLIHVSEMSWSTHLRSAQDFVKVGDEVEAVVLTLDREDRKMSLGIKQLSTDPWADITTKYPQNSKHTGKVRNFTNFGVFVELEEGIDGLIHISDLSWTKKVKHPSDFTHIGAELEVVVLDIDEDNRRLSLGHKQVEENPWETYETLLEEGSTLSGKVVEVVDKGANVMIENIGVEAFVPARHMVKEDGSKIEKDEVLDFVVLEFKREARRVLVSHTQVHKQVEAANAAKEAKAAGKAVKRVQNKVEKTTLGDLDALSQLKADLEDGENEGK
ncbi:MAG: 30S ribosomal protein S1 [Cryomorphaceae bacterium]|nr:30S ribosomal protein S1 [Cryomorphaceae bacterium]